MYFHLLNDPDFLDKRLCSSRGPLTPIWSPCMDDPPPGSKNGQTRRTVGSGSEVLECPDLGKLFCHRFRYFLLKSCTRKNVWLFWRFAHVVARLRTYVCVFSDLYSMDNEKVWRGEGVSRFQTTLDRQRKRGLNYRFWPDVLYGWLLN